VRCGGERGGSSRYHDYVEEIKERRIYHEGRGGGERKKSKDAETCAVNGIRYTRQKMPVLRRLMKVSLSRIGTKE